MTHLKHAPLVYVLGMIQFPKIPGIERFVDYFLDAIRKEYPLSDEVKVPVYTADFSSQGIQTGHHESRLSQFLSVDGKWGFILTEQGLFLHTVSYRDFEDFSSRFRAGLEALLKVENIGIHWITAVGVRYINLVIPQSTHKLNAYIHAWVLPEEPSNPLLSLVQSAYIARYKTEIGELRLQSLRNPQFTLPPELQSALLVKNGWVKARPEKDFALIDIDHSIAYPQPIKIESKQIMKTFSGLRGISKSVFESIGTEFALKEWK